MSHPLHDTFAMLLRDAKLSEPTLDPVPVLHALGQILLLEAVHLREQIGPAERDALLALGKTALQRARWMLREALSEDELDFIEESLPLAEAGLSLLRGERPNLSALPYERVEPSPSRIIEALRGGLPALEAGRLAMRYLRSGNETLRAAHDVRERLRANELVSQRLAAAPPEAIRDPREGERVFASDARGIELVLFRDDATLAAYAEDDYVSLGGAGITDVTHRTGFCLARLPHGAHGKLSLSLVVGDEEIDCEIVIDA
jgi:hypothetical protein